MNEIETIPAGQKRPRCNLGSSKRQIRVPNLISLQLKSYNEDFLQLGVAPSKLEDKGLHREFKFAFPIGDAISLEYDSYSLGELTFSEHECKVRGLTYSMPLRAKMRLVYYDTSGSEKQVREVKEQDVYVGDIPCMTDVGSYVINGTERVVVAQLYRSPGVSIEHDRGKTHSSGKFLYSARIIPYRGAWIDMEFDVKDTIYVRIDRRKKLPVTVLLKAMGYDQQAIIDHFYERDHFQIKDDQIIAKINPDRLKGKVATQDIIADDGTLICEKGTRIWVSYRKMKKLKVDSLVVERSYLLGQLAAHAIIDPETGEIIANVNESLTEEHLERIMSVGLSEFSTIYINELDRGGYISDTLAIDTTLTQLDAWVEIYRRFVQVSRQHLMLQRICLSLYSMTQVDMICLISVV